MHEPVTSILLEITEDAETNQDNTSKAPNMQIQTLMPALLPNLKPENSEKFNGTEFKRWQQKMFFYLAKFLQDDPQKSALIGTPFLQLMYKHMMIFFAKITF